MRCGGPLPRGVSSRYRRLESSEQLCVSLDAKAAPSRDGQRHASEQCGEHNVRWPADDGVRRRRVAGCDAHRAVDGLNGQRVVAATDLDRDGRALWSVIDEMLQRQREPVATEVLTWAL